jgi:hypothetical protein
MGERNPNSGEWYFYRQPGRFRGRADGEGLPFQENLNSHDRRSQSLPKIFAGDGFPESRYLVKSPASKAEDRPRAEALQRFIKAGQAPCGRAAICGKANQCRPDLMEIGPQIVQLEVLAQIFHPPSPAAQEERQH